MFWLFWQSPLAPRCLQGPLVRFVLQWLQAVQVPLVPQLMFPQVPLGLSGPQVLLVPHVPLIPQDPLGQLVPQVLPVLLVPHVPQVLLP